MDRAVQERPARAPRQRPVLGERVADLGASEVGGHSAEAAAAEGVCLGRGTPSAPVLSVRLQHPTHAFINLVVDQHAVSLQHRALLVVPRHPPRNARLEAVSRAQALLADHADVVVRVLCVWDAAGEGDFGDVQVEVCVQRALCRVDSVAENAPDRHRGGPGDVSRSRN